MYYIGKLAYFTYGCKKQKVILVLTISIALHEDSNQSGKTLMLINT